MMCIYNEKTWEYNEAVLQLFIDLKETYDSAMREVLNNIVAEFRIPIPHETGKANKNVSE